VTRRDRVLVAALVIGGVSAVIGVVLLASQLCPGPTADDPCPDADRNRLLVVGLATLAVVALMTGAAFVVDYAIHRRIVYLGAWSRAVRRGALTGLVLAAVAGLRLVDALNVFSAGVVVVVAGAVEWVAARRLDGP
jgi:hypothetical protein